MFDSVEEGGAIAVTSTARPKRIAFLVDKFNVTVEQVDSIAEYSSHRWGGRFDPILPTDGETIDHDWWQCLLATDADYVVSLLPLSDALVERINRTTLPIEITEPEDASRPCWEDLSALSTRDLPQYIWRRRSAIADIEVVFIKDTHVNPEVRPFVLRNFGVFAGDVFTASTFNGVKHRALDLRDMSLRTVFDAAFIERPRRPLFPIDFASSFATRAYSLQRGGGRDAVAFQLTVGSSPWDVMAHWNFGLQDRSDSGRDSLWLPEDQIENEEFLREIGEWTKRFYWGEGQRRRGNIVSYSVPTEALQALAAKLSPIAGMHFNVKALTPGAHPYAGSFDKFDRWVRSPFETVSERRTDQVALSGNIALVVQPAPAFLQHAEDRNGWMVDLAIEYRRSDINYMGAQPVWRVPKRPGVAYLFVEQGQNRARVQFGGLPSIEVASKDERFKLRLPSNRSIIWAGCFGHHHHKNTTRPHGSRTHQFDDIETSDKGQYLQGVIQLFGGLSPAERFFDDPFWRHIAYTLSSRDESQDFERQRQAIVIDVVNEALTRIGVPIALGSEHVADLAKAIGERLTFRDNEGRSMTLGQIRSAFGKRRREALRDKPDSGFWKAYERFDEYTQSDFDGYLERGVFLQGIGLRCPNCNLRLWRRIDELKPLVECDGCLRDFAMPADPEWSFRINNLIGNAIRYHDTLAVLMSLTRMQFAAHLGSVMFLPPQDLIRTRPEGVLVRRRGGDSVYTDLDLLLIGNGELIIGEVKSNPAGFRADQLEKLKIAALELLPDRVALVAVGTEWPQDVQRDIGALSEALSEHDVEVEKYLFSWDR